MARRELLPLLGVALALNACATRAYRVDPADAAALYAEGAQDLFTVSDAPPEPAARVFLVAGSAESANFAQEIVDQRRYWESVGIPPEQIACFYVPPYQEAYEADAAQFRLLAPELASCHLASVPELRAHLAAAGRTASQGDFVYLYVTSHGIPPVTEQLDHLERGQSGYWYYRRMSRYEALDRHQLVLDAMADGPADLWEKIGALRAGVDGADLFLTPATLTAMLQAGWGDARRIVVLQGCYSGGFIEDPSDPLPEERLPSVHPITVLTAARYDRVSFGCGTDEARTFFGGALQEALDASPLPPQEQDWHAVYAETARRVESLEESSGEYPSLPMFYGDW